MRSDQVAARDLTLRVIGAAVLVLVAIVTINGARVGLAQWLAFTADIPGVSPVGSSESLVRAATLAPQNGPLSLWVANRAHWELLSGWLSHDAAKLGELATDTARKALRAQPANPYARIHVARVMLDRARHLRTEQEARAILREQAGVHLATALALYPSSADVGYRVATALLRDWAVLERNTREVALRGVRRVGSLDRLRFPELLGKLAETLVNYRGSVNELSETLGRATPDVPSALEALSGRLQRLASSPPAGVPESWSEQARRAAVRAYADAARASAFLPRRSQRWIHSSTSFLPDEIPQLVEQTRIATTDNPVVAGAWLARAWAAQAAGQVEEARHAAERARNLARAVLFRRLELATDRVSGNDAVADDRLLVVAATRMRGLRGADRTAIGGAREAIERARRVLKQAIKLLSELGPMTTGLP